MSAPAGSALSTEICTSSSSRSLSLHIIFLVIFLGVGTLVPVVPVVTVVLRQIVLHQKLVFFAIVLRLLEPLLVIHRDLGQA
jgi:hypothetical protein